MSEPMEMNCNELARVAPELALGVLTGRERADAVAHLAVCDGCREYVRQLIETHEGLLALLPPKEPSAGFETRVLDRLGLPATRPQRAGTTLSGWTGLGPRLPGQAGSGQAGSGHTLPGQATPGQALPGQGGPRGTEPHRPGRPGGASRPGGPLNPPGRRRALQRRSGASRSRRLLAAGAVLLAIAGAGLSGWGLGMGTAARPGPPPGSSQEQDQLSSAVFFTPSHQDVGQLFYYRGSPRWLYMSVELPAGNGMVTCQVVTADGTVSTVGSFRLADGYGAWGSPDPGITGLVRGARLIAPDGTTLATAAF